MSDSSQKFCVYMHTTPNGKRYVGITSKKPEYRWDRGRGYCYNKHFSAAIAKYGWENIKHEILFENLTEEEANEKEIRLIQLYQSNNPAYGYNSAGGGMGRNMLGLHQSEATKKLLSEKRMGENNPFYGKSHTPMALERMKRGREKAVEKIKRKVVCLETGEVFESLIAAAKSINGDSASMWACCRKNIRHHKGLHWRYADETPDVKAELEIALQSENKPPKANRPAQGSKKKSVAKPVEIIVGLVKNPSKEKVHKCNQKKPLNIIGYRFGRLVALEKTKTKGGRTAYLCRCDCGKEKIVPYDSLRSGSSRSCGCLYRETNGSHHRTHGMKRTALYSRWIDMKRRCYDSDVRAYQGCGSIGISVCEEWRNDFENFYAWAIRSGFDAENQSQYIVKRRDTTKDFTPQNCFIQKKPNRKAARRTW